MEERFISDLNDWKFISGEPQKLNPGINFDNVNDIYETGWCNSKEKFPDGLKNLINEIRLDRNSDLNNTFRKGKMKGVTFLLALTSKPTYGQ